MKNSPDSLERALGSGLSFAHPELWGQVFHLLIPRRSVLSFRRDARFSRFWGQVFHLLIPRGLERTLGSGLSFAHERSVDACGVFLKRRGLSESSVATTSSAASEGIPRARPLPRRSSSAGLHASQASARLRHQEGLSFAHAALIDGDGLAGDKWHAHNPGSPFKGWASWRGRCESSLRAVCIT